MKKKIIAITGSSGFIAGHLIKTLKEYEFVKISKQEFTKDPKELMKKIQKADAVIHLAGAPVIKRWTKRNKKEIFNSRVQTTKKIREAIFAANRNIHLLSASAIGIYNDKDEHTEKSTKYSEGFLYEVIHNWEKEAGGKSNDKVNTTIMRIGIVLAKDGGIYRTMRPLFKNYIGGKIGQGKQWMSFIHIIDLVYAIKFILEKNICGIINITAPNQVTNKEFTRLMAGLLKKPAFLIIPVFALRLLFGEGASVLYKGQKVIPEILMQQGFKFKFPDIEKALRDIIVE